MAFDNKYPYTDFHELNLDWLLEKVKGIDDRFVAIEEAVAALHEDLDIQTGRIDAALDAITFIQNHYPAMIASEYDESRQYDPGEIAIYDNELYIALPGETPGPWNGNFWNKTSLGDELGTIIIKVNDIILPDLTNINNVLAEYGTLFDDIVETYVPGSTYTKNQMVKYEDHIYRVMVASTSNLPTDLTDWDPETLANIVTDLLNAEDSIIAYYSDNVSYTVGQYVRYNDIVYVCIEDTSGPFDNDKWSPCVYANDISFRLDSLSESKEYYKRFPVKHLEYSVVNVTDAITGRLENALVNFTPIQSGSGSPTPNNIRNISGRNELNLYYDETQSATPENTVTEYFQSTAYQGHFDFVSGIGQSSNLVLLTFTSAVYYGIFGDDSAPLFYVDITGKHVKQMATSNMAGTILSNMLSKTTATTSAGMHNYEVRTEASGQPTKLYFRMDDFTSEAEINAFLIDNPLQVLATTTDAPEDIISGSHDIIPLNGTNAFWTDGDDLEIDYHYAEQTVDYTPDDRVVVIGTYSGKRVLQINHFEQNVSLDGSLKSFNILPPNAILINAWAFGKGNDDGTMANMNPWWSTEAGDLCIQASSWASNTSADIWMYAQYVE